MAAHPDDELIGAGGSLIKNARAGHEVTLVHLVGREPTMGTLINDQQYRDEVANASRMLGAQQCIELGAPSRDLSETRELRLALTKILRQTQPHIVYLPHAAEVDAEHQMVHRLTLDALWMASADFFPEAGAELASPPNLVLAYEVWTPMSSYHYVEDITIYLSAKLDAMRAYRSQLAHVAWDRAIEGLAAYRGAVALRGGQAEVFQVLALNVAAERCVGDL